MLVNEILFNSMFESSTHFQPALPLIQQYQRRLHTVRRIILDEEHSLSLGVLLGSCVATATQNLILHVPVVIHVT